MADKKETEVYLKLVIDRNKKKVVFAEANSDFVDILFSFLTLPMGTIVRILANRSDPSSRKANIGSFNNLYASVSNLDTMYFVTKECRDVLLSTRSSAEVQCRKLMINIDDVKPTQYFVCDLCIDKYKSGSYASLYVSTCSTVPCHHCQNFLKRAIDFDDDGESVFVAKTSSFVISDDLHVIPNNPTSTLGILKSCGIKDFAALEEINTLKLGSSEIFHLLECSFFSKNALSDFYFGKKLKSVEVPTIEPSLRTECTGGAKKITFKVYVQKSTNKILLAHCSEDFVNFLLSLLTVPLGKVISLFPGDHESLNIEHIHQSVTKLNVGEYLKSQQLKDMLLYPKLLSQYFCPSHIFPLEEQNSLYKYLKRTSTAGGRDFYSISLDSTQSYKYLSDISPISKIGGGFVRGPTKFMVTDDLVVTPLSSMSCFAYLQELKVPLNDIEEQEIHFGMNEAVNLLWASLTSTSALSNGLKFFILKNPKQETSVNKPSAERSGVKLEQGHF
ncbi:hypothetical protein DCAR_0518668 [Daucus carota subsp. sativus]|uniref:Uncharacterized protein n=1 Tax=Daucus carota subsp. sativus TaxID=79200 RepID=A0A164XEM1_DAUCS|nr:PREDICTED: uncharacterized protein LOC108221153 [Daucus carota subsp. sativus]WOG99320.1 hypothetical protein DCAR_0518668 [Daucus carota subsp. sativus]